MIKLHPRAKIFQATTPLSSFQPVLDLGTDAETRMILDRKDMQSTIFVSHSSKYSDLAKAFKRSLLALDDNLRILISEEMAGAQDWRAWINSSVKSADAFVLLYPSANMEMGWCNYEVGRFYDNNKPITFIRNTNIKEAPPAFQPYQGYQAHTSDIDKFLVDLFVNGALSGKILNADVAKISSEYYRRARDVSRDIVAQFAEARVHEQFHDKRIVVSVGYDSSKKLDLEKTVIQGNEHGMTLLGMNGATKWATLQIALGEKGCWLDELRSIIETTPIDASPPPLPPFLSRGKVHIPTIAKRESVDGQLRELALIFSAASSDSLLSLLKWTFPKNMPGAIKKLVRLYRILFTARWDIVEPRLQRVRYRETEAVDRQNIIEEIKHEYDNLSLEIEKADLGAVSKFHSIFHKNLRPKIDELTDEWMLIMKQLKSTDPSDPESSAILVRILSSLLRNNAGWMDLATQQMKICVEEL